MQLYKSLVRLHLEFAVPVWAAASGKDLSIRLLNQYQVQCLRRITCAKAYSSGSVIEVITGTVPMKTGIRGLCSREYLHIMSKDEGHYLRQLYLCLFCKCLRFCPLNYLSVMSKQLSRSLDGFSLCSEGKSSAIVMMTPSKLQLSSITSIESTALSTIIGRRSRSKRYMRKSVLL